ncbi:MAG: leucine-rich repeat protein [Bacteroidales bacterium]|nr:leucine-rich repeat protein [Bacteroidales bacterium]
MRKNIILALAALLSLPMWGVTVASQPGELSTLITDHSVTSLKVTGGMDARDFKFIAERLDSLQEIDLSEVVISAYVDNYAPVLGGENRFEAASIPCTSFFGKPLTSVVLPASLKSVGFAAFAGCDRLTAINIPASVDSIAGYAFSSTGLTTLSLPATVKTVGNGAFSRCASLASATVASATIGNEAFYADSTLASLTLGAEVKTIGDAAFKACSALSTLSVEGTGISSLGAEAFAYTSLSSLDLSTQTSLTAIHDWALAKSQLTTVVLPASTSMMGDGVFFYSTLLESANLPTAITEVPAFTFAGAEALATDSILPASAVKMGDFSFYNACALTSFVVPASMQRIGTMAMAGTTGMQVIKVYTTYVPELGDSVWAGVDQPRVNLDVKSAKAAHLFETTDQWKEFHILKDYIMGDVNGDGLLDVSDVSAMISYVLGDVPDPFIIEVADLTGDGNIDISDVTTLIEYVLEGKIIVIRRTPKPQF